ncbi:hypothetical protein N7481_002572 [Penicillium waksmanii]|uniref:uncharacterized protein n=1 Tax=Penicillium waksmanii TaxID=69791 RepID=UPI00254888A3|nr:uncharacterized protein N7481_002572 [Penicillium waksmanii]KAJ5995595.1 hypothetical protein N7481_002572 [Penicillium waksmanii]
MPISSLTGLVKVSFVVMCMWSGPALSARMCKDVSRIGSKGFFESCWRQRAKLNSHTAPRWWFLGRE